MHSPDTKRRPSEEGYVLVAVVFMTAILVLSLAVALPRVRESIQRDREIETMQRGKQYVRAVQLYYKKFNAYPPNVDALVKSNNIRFLRKKYIDPTTGKEEWKPVMFGQNKTPQAMGFFGQPLAASSLAGIGPGGTGAPGAGGLGVGTGSSSSAGSGLFGTSTIGSPSTPTTGSSGGTDSNGNPLPAGGAGATGGGQSGTTGTGTTSGAGSTPSGGSSAFGSGQTFGGAGIIGFSPQSPKQSILIYKKKNHYNEWEFLYSPQMDRQTQGIGNTGAIGQPASSTTTPIGTPTGTSTGTGTGPTTPTTPTTPQ